MGRVPGFNGEVKNFSETSFKVKMNAGISLSSYIDATIELRSKAKRT